MLLQLLQLHHPKTYFSSPGRRFLQGLSLASRAEDLPLASGAGELLHAGIEAQQGSRSPRVASLSSLWTRPQPEHTTRVLPW